MITASAVHHYIAEHTPTGDWYRRLTPTELARAQGLPDNYQLAGTKADQVRQIGNAVTVQVAEAVGHAVQSKLRQEAA